MTRFRGLLSAAILGVGVLASLAARPVDDALKVGDPAPDFTLPGSDGKTHSLSELKGKHVVLAWFPKAFTGG